uniref:Uncharacterized protein n=1 Tax=viral metagenome TaxID=1070528 RepID=A0A6C0HPA9_9ZZZZ
MSNFGKPRDFTKLGFSQKGILHQNAVIAKFLIQKVLS